MDEADAEIRSLTGSDDQYYSVMTDFAKYVVDVDLTNPDSLNGSRILGTQMHPKHFWSLQGDKYPSLHKIAI